MTPYLSLNNDNILSYKQATELGMISGGKLGLSCTHSCFDMFWGSLDEGFSSRRSFCALVRWGMSLAANQARPISCFHESMNCNFCGVLTVKKKKTCGVLLVGKFVISSVPLVIHSQWILCFELNIVKIPLNSTAALGRKDHELIWSEDVVLLPCVWCEKENLTPLLRYFCLVRGYKSLRVYYLSNIQRLFLFQFTCRFDFWFQIELSFIQDIFTCVIDK